MGFCIKMKSYILIDSTYRDRLLYPNPAEFDLPFQLVNSQILNPSVFSATNPLSLSYPDYNFQWLAGVEGSDLSTISGRIVGGTAEAPILDPSIDVILSINGVRPTIYTSIISATRIFRGLKFIIDNDYASPLTIVDYDPITRIISLNGNIINFTGNHQYQIVNPSTRDTIYILGDFINRTGVVYYDLESMYVYDIALNELQRVVSYNAVDQYAILAKPFSSEWRPIDPYVIISQKVVINYGTIMPLETDQYFVDQTVHQYRVEGRGRGYRNGDVVRAIPQGRVFTTRAVQYLVLRTSPVGEIVDMQYTDAGSLEYPVGTVCVLYNGDGTLPSEAARIVVTDTVSVFKVRFVGRIMPDSIIKNLFLPVLLSSSFVVQDGELKISSNSTLPIKDDPIPIDLMNSFYKNGVSGIRGCIPISDTEAFVLVQAYPQLLLDRFRYVPDQNNAYLKGCTNCLILPYTGEGVVGLNFTGTQLTLSQASCYRISVMSLILPNLTIDVGSGPLTSFFPYVFLEISNVSNSNGRNKSILYSNNPYTSNVTFVCSISDVNNPLTTRFIKITSDGSSQTLKFTPVDALRFRVSLPDGTTFRTARTDYLVPVAPDPRIQVHAVLEIERL